MKEERWQEIVSLIEDKFGIDEKEKKELEDVPGGTLEIIIFTGPVGKMKLEWRTMPRVLDKKTFYSHRGAASKVDYVYDQEDLTHEFRVYQWDEGREDWVALEKAEEMF